jgi:hypothetical protein
VLYDDIPAFSTGVLFRERNNRNSKQIYGVAKDVRVFLVELESSTNEY